MEAILRTGAAAPLPHTSRESIGSPVAALRRRIFKCFYRFAERMPELHRDPPPEWFRYPLP